LIASLLVEGLSPSAGGFGGESAPAMQPRIERVVGQGLPGVRLSRFSRGTFSTRCG